MARTPLAFQPLPDSIAAAHPDLAAKIQALQQQFNNAVAAVQGSGGAAQDTNSATYLNRWVTAQRSIDEQYHLIVGDQAFLMEQMQTSASR